MVLKWPKMFMALPRPKLFMDLKWPKIPLTLITLNTFALLKFLENGDKTTKVMPRSASLTLCSRLKIMIENVSFQGYFTEVSFDTPEGNQLSHFKNLLFFQNLLVIS